MTNADIHVALGVEVGQGGLPIILKWFMIYNQEILQTTPLGILHPVTLISYKFTFLNISFKTLLKKEKTLCNIIWEFFPIYAGPVKI